MAKNKNSSGVKSNPDILPVKSMKALAELVGRDRGQVSRWTKREDWPFSPRAPWVRADVPKIIRWVADTLERTGGAKEADDAVGGEADPDSIAALKKQKLREEIRRLAEDIRGLRARANAAETELDRVRGRLMDADQVARDFAAAGVNVRNGLQNLPSQVVPLALGHGMPGDAAQEFQGQVEELVTAILKRLSGDEGEGNGDSH